MQRVVILGNAGAGKSTLAKRLAAIVGAPVVHLDAHFWQPGWQPTPRDEWRERVRALAAHESWIMDGNYAATLGVRLSRADTVEVLHAPRALCVYRVVHPMLREIETTGAAGSMVMLRSSADIAKFLASANAGSVG